MMSVYVARDCPSTTTVGQLVEDDPVDVGAVGCAGDVDGEAGAGEPVDVEVLLHHPAGAEDAEPRPAGRAGPVGDGVGDVEQRNVDGRLDVVGDPVHEVGADQHDVGARLLAALCRLAQQRACGGPVAADLAVPDLGEVERLRATTLAEAWPPSRSATSSLMTR